MKHKFIEVRSKSILITCERCSEQREIVLQRKERFKKKEIENVKKEMESTCCYQETQE